MILCHSFFLHPPLPLLPPLTIMSKVVKPRLVQGSGEGAQGEGTGKWATRSYLANVVVICLGEFCVASTQTLHLSQRKSFVGSPGIFPFDLLSSSSAFLQRHTNRMPFCWGHLDLIGHLLGPDLSTQARSPSSGVCQHARIASCPPELFQCLSSSSTLPHLK